MQIKHNRRRIHTRVNGKGNGRNIFHAFLPKSVISTTSIRQQRSGIKTKMSTPSLSPSQVSLPQSTFQSELAYMMMKKDITILQERVEKLCERIFVLESQLEYQHPHQYPSYHIPIVLPPPITESQKHYLSSLPSNYQHTLPDLTDNNNINYTESSSVFSNDLVTSITEPITTTTTTTTMMMSVKVEPCEDVTDDDDEHQRQFDVYRRHLSRLNTTFQKKYFPDGTWDETHYRSYCTSKSIDVNSPMGKRIRTITIDDLSSSSSSLSSTTR